MTRTIMVGTTALTAPGMLEALADASPQLGDLLSSTDDITQVPLTIDGLEALFTCGHGTLSVVVMLDGSTRLEISAEEEEGFAVGLGWDDADEAFVERIEAAYGRRIDTVVQLPPVLQPFAASTLGSSDADWNDEGLYLTVTIEEASEAAPLQVLPGTRPRNPPRPAL